MTGAGQLGPMNISLIILAKMVRKKKKKVKSLVTLYAKV